MASIATPADAIRSAVASIQTCTPTISATLKELLQGSDADINASASTTATTKSRPTKGPTSRGHINANGATRRGAEAKIQLAQRDGGTHAGLPAKEKAVLATQVVNATLKSLGDAAKQAHAIAPVSQSPAKSGSRKTLRRSNSVPITPLQPKSLNRVPTSPAGVKTVCRSPTSSPSSGCLATVECARVAFSTLRALSNSGKIVLPELQLESGMSSFVNKLIALNLFEHALKEIRSLKRRLEVMAIGAGDKKTKSTTTTAETTLSTRSLSDLFEYPAIEFSGPVLSLVITTQLQALRMIYGLKKSSHLDTALPFLRATYRASPVALLMSSAKVNNSDNAKCARQLESLAQSLLSLSPSVSAKDDGVAVEPRLSPSPETALEIQALALATRLHSWSLSGHKGDVDRDILLPLSRCLSAYTRRSATELHVKANLANAVFDQVWQRIEATKLQPSHSSKSPLTDIYQALGTTCRDAGNIKEATAWMTKLKSISDAKADSPAQYCSVTAQLLALSLRQGSKFDESLIVEVLDGLQGSLSGNTTELDNLLVSICLVRKAAMSTVLHDGQLRKTADPTQGLLENLLLQLPRFALRWLGKPPQASSDSAKELLRFEQRRQLLSKYLHHLLDSALMLTKALMDAGKLPWDLMDPVMQDSMAVLDNMGNLAVQGLKSNPAASYHVKISHFYYQQHILLRQNSSGKDTQHLRALRRSIDAVKLRTEAEQLKAQLLTKQERLAELCKSSGRQDDAADSLRSIRDALVRDGVVEGITGALSSIGFVQAWKMDAKAQTLSRTVTNLAKVDRTPCDWTWLLLNGPEKMTALEHDLYFVHSVDNRSRKLLVPDEGPADKLLQLMPKEVYPIRRLRTLLQLLTVKFEQRTEAQGWMEEAADLSRGMNKKELGNDSRLAHYLPHLQALTSCLAALFDGTIASLAIQDAVMNWTTTIERCQSVNQLYDSIDNPQQLLVNLQSLADFARMRGLNSLVSSVLLASTGLTRLIGNDEPELLISQNTALGLQYLMTGHSSQAQKILKSSQPHLASAKTTSTIAAMFHLHSAEYQLAVGNFDFAERALAEAHASAAVQDSRELARSSRATRKMGIAYASFLYSVLALERGNADHALHYAKNAVRILFHDWARLETLRDAPGGQMDESTRIESSEDDTSFSSSRSSQLDIVRANTGPEFWAISYPLFRFTLQLSSIYAHVGMYQETMYYAEQAQKVATSTESVAYIAQSKAWLAYVSLTAGKVETALVLAAEVKETLPKLEPACAVFDMTSQLSRVYRDCGDQQSESEIMALAASFLEKLGFDAQASGMDELESRMESLTMKEKPALKTMTRQAKAKVLTTTTKPTKKSAPKRIVPAKLKTLLDKPIPMATADIQLRFLRVSWLQQQSASLLERKEWSKAVSALQEACELSKLSNDITQEGLLMGIALIGQSLEQMGHDSVFSVIQYSTLSFPAIAGSAKEKLGSDRGSPIKPSPARKGRSGGDKSHEFIENLRKAQDHLLEAHSVASLNGNGRLVHRIAALLQSVFILLSTASPSKQPSTGHPAHATCSIELARNLVWGRERKTIGFDQNKAEKAEWPALLQTIDSKRSSLGFSIDMNKFQREYIDIIPASWNVVSISLSDNKHDLCITKLQAGHSPFAVRLPLERAVSRDADIEVFDYQQGRAELLNIIELANRTCHDARDMSAKGAKSSWWAEREALDERLKDLLENVEQTWLGGFKGIFGQHHRRSDLLASFQKSFTNILDKHLPSRRQVRGRRTKASTCSKVSLDPRILDLFVGLGDATLPDIDLDEPLTDLLYFVVDILQFHGEQNAYDEIDFDSMVVESFDAIHSYHAAAKANSKHDEDSVHTILVLDKGLQVFPWESLPCMQGLVVSRIPSLACLRRSILEQRGSNMRSTTDNDDTVESSSAGPGREGHHITVSSGTYMLNPSADLRSTQATFGGPLASLPAGWTAIEGRAPSEAEFEAALTGADLLLYFGHGSGAQYVRGRTVRKLAKCRAVALLMGCSSASLADVGEFEPHGTVRNYMLAGAPAVVGTLWDVTDRDIDRYAARVFEEWGLLPRGTFADDAGRGAAAAAAAAAVGPASRSRGGAATKGKKKAGRVKDRGEDGEEEIKEKETSLVEAVAKARSACRFRYLTAAAVVCYGIPVYIGK